MEKNIALIPGDGIGPDVVAEAVNVLNAVASKFGHKFNYETVYADINSSRQGYFDLELMKHCKHNIIANSSFSWWGAWLNENENKIVVAPEKWIATLDSNYDIIPENWITLQNLK